MEGPHLDSAWWNILCFVLSFSFLYFLEYLCCLLILFLLSLSLFGFPYEKIGGIFVADLNSSFPLSPASSSILHFYAFSSFSFFTSLLSHSKHLCRTSTIMFYSSNPFTDFMFMKIFTSSIKYVFMYFFIRFVINKMK